MNALGPSLTAPIKIVEVRPEVVKGKLVVSCKEILVKWPEQMVHVEDAQKRFAEIRDQQKDTSWLDNIGWW